MKESLIEMGVIEFEKNYSDFFKRFRQIILEDESLLDDSSSVKSFCNLHNDGVLYFRFEISTFRMMSSTEYYRFDYNFKNGIESNIDEIISNEKDVEILVYSGNDIKDYFNEY